MLKRHGFLLSSGESASPPRDPWPGGMISEDLPLRPSPPPGLLLFPCAVCSLGGTRCVVPSRCPGGLGLETATQALPSCAGPLPHFLPSVLCTSACLLSVCPTRRLTRQDWTGRTCLSIDCCAPSASCLPAQSGCSTGCQTGMKCWVAQRDQAPLLGVGGGWGGLVNAAA